MRTLGHDVLSKMLVKCRNGTAICRGAEEFTKLWAERENGGAMWARFVVTTVQSSPCQGNTSPAQGSRNYRDLTSYHRFL